MIFQPAFGMRSNKTIVEKNAKKISNPQPIWSTTPKRIICNKFAANFLLFVIFYR